MVCPTNISKTRYISHPNNGVCFWIPLPTTSKIEEGVFLRFRFGFHPNTSPELTPPFLFGSPLFSTSQAYIYHIYKSTLLSYVYISLWFFLLGSSFQPRGSPKKIQEPLAAGHGRRGDGVAGLRGSEAEAPPGSGLVTCQGWSCESPKAPVFLVCSVFYYTYMYNMICIYIYIIYPLIFAASQNRPLCAIFGNG